MFRSLRARMTFSHILPVIIIAPVVTFLLLYLLETRYFLDNLASELIVQANIITYYTRQNGELWRNQADAQALVGRLESSIPARIMLLDGQGKLLASSLASDASRVGQVIQMPVVSEALQGQPAWISDYNPFLGQRVVDVAVPVQNPSSQMIGIVRLSHDLQSIQARLIPVWGLILFSLVIAMLLALILGLALAQSLSAPLRRLADAVLKLTPGTQPETVPEDGPTEVKALAEGFNQMAHRLYQVEQSRRSLLANFVHELGTPLGAIKAAAQALQEGAISDSDLGLELAEGINIEVDQLRRLLDDLALLGETEMRTPALILELVDIGDVVETVCRSYAYLVKQKNIQLDYDVDHHLPPIEADPTRLHQIISNLLHNAYKYTPANGRIEVRAEGDGNPLRDICVTVKDTGPGIAESEQEKIFRMFYRGSGLAQRHPGMGIGLTLARQLAEAHGGTLTVISKPGEGAAFALRLPVQYPHGP